MDVGLRKRLDGRRFTVGLDEGGLRCLAKDRVAYIPYDAVVDATFANTYYGRTLLVLELASGERAKDRTIRIELANGNPFDVLGAVLAHVTRPHPSSRLAVLRRNGDAFDVWLARVRAIAIGDGGAGYRDGAAAVDASALAATLEDADASMEERAAAAHALLELGTDDALSSVARVLLVRAVPPIVLVGVGLGRAGSALVDDELFADMRALLGPADEAAAKAIPRRDDEAQATRLAAVIEAAKREAAAAFEAAAASRDRKSHGLPVLGRDDSLRWIGRSWGL